VNHSTLGSRVIKKKKLRGVLPVLYVVVGYSETPTPKP